MFLKQTHNFVRLKYIYVSQLLKGFFYLKRAYDMNNEKININFIKPYVIYLVFFRDRNRYNS